MSILALCRNLFDIDVRYFSTSEGGQASGVMGERLGVACTPSGVRCWGGACFPGVAARWPYPALR